MDYFSHLSEFKCCGSLELNDLKINIKLKVIFANQHLLCFLYRKTQRKDYNIIQYVIVTENVSGERKYAG